MLPFTYAFDNSDNVSTSNQTATTTENQSWTKLTFVTFYMILPIAGLAFLWGRKDLVTKFLTQIDRNCVSVFCPSLSRRQKLLKWASHQLPSSSIQQSQTLSNGINELWQDGSLLCTIINTVVPGACPNPYRHWKKPPIHAQALAYKYFELAPIFSSKDLSSDLTINQEHNFIHYLYELQEAINKWPTVTKDFDTARFSSQYVARGMGLYTGEQYRKTVFYIYAKNPSTTTTTKTSDIFMYIRGPYGTKGKAIIPTTNHLKTIPTINELQQLNKNNNNKAKNTASSLLKNLSFDFKSLLNNNNNNNNNENNNNNCELNDIQIRIEHESDRIKIIYIPNNYGIHEINLIINGELFKGSPFYININKNTTDIRDSFKQNSIFDNKNRNKIKKRRIISKTIDCIDEKLIIDNDKIRKIPQLTQIKENEIDDNIVDNDNHLRIDTPDSSICTQDSGIDVNIKINDCIDNINNEETTIRICLDVKDVDTSPICPNHIDNEVVISDKNTENPQLTLDEKRRQFSKQHNINYSITTTTTTMTNSSSYSTSIENHDGSKFYNNNDKNRGDDEFKELSVMNVLESIKQSSRNNSLCNTISLPDMTDLYQYENLFKAKREFWERIAHNSNTTSSIPVEINKQQHNNYKYSKKIIYKSSDNLLPTKVVNDTLIRKYKSVDDTLDDYQVLTVEERKKNLLKDRNAKEIVENSKIEKTVEEIPIQDEFLPVSERIRQFNNEVIHQQSGSVNRITKLIKKSPPTIDGTKKQTPIEKFKSPFKRAINYFKNLEESSTIKSNKIKNNKKKSTIKQRRYSLDNEKYNNDKKELNKRQGGSLSLSNVSQRFSINNLYEDIIGDGDHFTLLKRNSFKGTPNRDAVIDSLASLNHNGDSLKSHNKYLQQEDESCIKYNLFINGGKMRKRQSICTVFDVNY